MGGQRLNGRPSGFRVKPGMTASGSGGLMSRYFLGPLQRFLLTQPPIPLPVVHNVFSKCFGHSGGIERWVIEAKW